MNYPETLDWLYTRLPAFSRIGAPAYKPSLGNIEALCAALGQPQQSFRCIHVAGTNGKGSVSHMLAAILQSAGYKTGLYTSPHLKDFRERIKINGQPCTQDFVVQFTADLQAELTHIEPSFFELTVALAFSYFRQEKVDIAIIETGLGGRLDSTNVVQPLASVITNIGFDHMQFLGNTLPAIAAEKAGIIKPGAPVVIGEYHSETWPVFVEKAATCKTPLLLAEHELRVQIAAQQKDMLLLEVRRHGRQQIQSYHCQLAGRYQAKNVATVLCTLAQLPPQFQVREEAIVQGLQQVITLTGLHGRWELLAKTPDVYVDVAHNEPGVEQMLEQIDKMKYAHLHLVCGFVADKSLDPLLKMLPKQAIYYFTQAQIQRALAKETLLQRAMGYGLQGTLYNHVDEAVAKAQAAAGPNDLIVVFGSIFLAGELSLLKVEMH